MVTETIIIKAFWTFEKGMSLKMPDDKKDIVKRAGTVPKPNNTITKTPEVILG